MLKTQRDDRLTDGAPQWTGGKRVSTSMERCQFARAPAAALVAGLFGCVRGAGACVRGAGACVWGSRRQCNQCRCSKMQRSQHPQNNNEWYRAAELPWHARGRTQPGKLGKHGRRLGGGFHWPLCGRPARTKQGGSQWGQTNMNQFLANRCLRAWGDCCAQTAGRVPWFRCVAGGGSERLATAFHGLPLRPTRAGIGKRRARVLD